MVEVGNGSHGWIVEVSSTPIACWLTCRSCIGGISPVFGHDDLDASGRSRKQFRGHICIRVYGRSGFRDHSDRLRTRQWNSDGQFFFASVGFSRRACKWRIGGLCSVGHVWFGGHNERARTGPDSGRPVRSRDLHQFYARQFIHSVGRCGQNPSRGELFRQLRRSEFRRFHQWRGVCIHRVFRLHESEPFDHRPEQFYLRAHRGLDLGDLRRTAGRLAGVVRQRRHARYDRKSRTRDDAARGGWVGPCRVGAAKRAEQSARLACRDTITSS